MSRNTTYGTSNEDSNSNKSDQYKKPRARVNKVINTLVTKQIEENKDEEEIVRNILQGVTLLVRNWKADH